MTFAYEFEFPYYYLLVWVWCEYIGLLVILGLVWSFCVCTLLSSLRLGVGFVIIGVGCDFLGWWFACYVFGFDL